MRLAFIFAALLAASPASAQWQYSTEKDEMRGLALRVASVKAAKPVRLSFPYAGGSTIRLFLRRGDETSVYFIVDRGQFFCATLLDVKFDDGPIQWFRCRRTESGNTQILFIGDEQNFIAQLRRAKRLTISAPFYQDGERQIIFDVRNLTWGE